MMTLFLQNCFIEVHIVSMIKESKFNWCSNHKLCIINEDLVNNGYSLFAEEVILKPQYAEEFI